MMLRPELSAHPSPDRLGSTGCVVEPPAAEIPSEKPGLRRRLSTAAAQSMCPRGQRPIAGAPPSYRTSHSNPCRHSGCCEMGLGTEEAETARDLHTPRKIETDWPSAARACNPCTASSFLRHSRRAHVRLPSLLDEVQAAPGLQRLDERERWGTSSRLRLLHDYRHRLVTEALAQYPLQPLCVPRVQAPKQPEVRVVEHSLPTLAQGSLDAFLVEPASARSSARVDNRTEAAKQRCL